MSTIQTDQITTNSIRSALVTSDAKAVVAIYNTHLEAEVAVNELQRAGFDVKKLPVVGKDYHTDEQVVRYYNAGDRMKYWGKLGALWGGLWACFAARLSFGCLASVHCMLPVRWQSQSWLPSKARLWSVV